VEGSIATTRTVGETTIDAPVRSCSTWPETSRPDCDMTCGSLPGKWRGLVGRTSPVVAEPKAWVKGRMSLEIPEYGKGRRLHNVERSSYMPGRQYGDFGSPGHPLANATWARCGSSPHCSLAPCSMGSIGIPAGPPGSDAGSMRSRSRWPGTFGGRPGSASPCWAPSPSFPSLSVVTMPRWPVVGTGAPRSSRCWMG
jgi:hypothetical protein